MAVCQNVREVIDALGVEMKVCGLVKDQFHNTRALINREEEIELREVLCIRCLL